MSVRLIWDGREWRADGPVDFPAGTEFEAFPRPESVGLSERWKELSVEEKTRTIHAIGRRSSKPTLSSQWNAERAIDDAR